MVLKPFDKYESDYVNASYVDVSTQPLSVRIYFMYIHLPSLPRDTLHQGSSLPLKVHTHLTLHVCVKAILVCHCSGPLPKTVVDF